MGKIYKVMSVFAVLLAVQFFSLPVHAGMTGEKIMATLYGNTFSFSGKGTTGSVQYSKNGTSKAWGKDWVNNGKWWVKGNKMCTRRKRKGKVSTRCSTMTRLGGDRYKTSSGYTLKRK